MSNNDATPGAAWTPLDRGTRKVTALLLLGVSVLAGVPTTIGLTPWLSFGVTMMWVLSGAGLLIAGGVLADHLRWCKTRYRVLADSVELRKGILFVSRRRLARDRIRAVDLSAHVVLRVFGLVRLTLGTGEQGGGGSSTHSIVLDPIPRRVGEHLRAVLLGHKGADEEHRPERLGTWRPAWTGYAALSVVTPLLAGAIVGGVFQVSDWLGRGALPVEFAHDRVTEYGLWTVLLVALPVLILAAALLAMGFYVESWWRYRLEREPGGTLRVKRGLLTSRSLSLEEVRVRGVDVIEPLGVRMAGAARVQVVATGLSAEADPASEDSVLLPAAPRALAVRVAERITGQSPDIGLTDHPTAARTRRLRWALTITLGLALGWAAVAYLAAWAAPWTAATGAAVAVIGAALVVRAVDSARNLGHALTDGHLLARRGSIRRSTVLLQRRGIIGWRIRQSVFQRRAGLATLVAVTAAGRGHYPVIDADEREVVAFADAAVPDLLSRFRPRDRPKGDALTAG
ncbi:PH domain-containing protein [Nocardiopsis oceani]